MLTVSGFDTPRRVSDIYRPYNDHWGTPAPEEGLKCKCE